MLDTRSDLVIQISTGGQESDGLGASGERAEGSRLVSELCQYLRPGIEIALVLGGYSVVTSIRWFSGPLLDHTLRVGVRLLGASGPPPGEHCDRFAAGAQDASSRHT